MIPRLRGSITKLTTHDTPLISPLGLVEFSIQWFWSVATNPLLELTCIQTYHSRLFTVHHSLFIIIYSMFLILRSANLIQYSLFGIQYPPLTTHHSPLHHSPLTTHHSRLTTHNSPPTTTPLHRSASHKNQCPH